MLCRDTLSLQLRILEPRASTVDPAPLIMYSIRLAEDRDLHALSAIELAAARMLAGHAPESVLAEATPLADFQTAMTAGLLWVASTEAVPVGFAQVKLLESGSAHLDELDVHPEHGRRGLGRRLVTAVCEWAAGERLPQVTLSTFRDVPWNMPFYASLGFAVVAPPERSDAMRAIVADETRRGLNPDRRVIMRRAL